LAQDSTLCTQKSGATAQFAVCGPFLHVTSWSWFFYLTKCIPAFPRLPRATRVALTCLLQGPCQAGFHVNVNIHVQPSASLPTTRATAPALGSTVLTARLWVISFCGKVAFRLGAGTSPLTRGWWQVEVFLPVTGSGGPWLLWGQGMRGD
jgi:hypothetical protein